MSDLGTVSILVDVRGQPVVKELATDLNNVAAAETKVSAATQKVMEDFRRTREILANVKKATDDTSASFQRFSAKELQQASQRMNGFERTLANTRRGMGDMGMATQQVGYQVGDFLVQVQSGTNWMVAFGQQATQLVGIMPSFAGSLGMSVGSMIALSSGLGIAIPLVTAIGAAFMRSGEETKEGADRASDAAKSLKADIERLELDNIKIGFNIDSDSVAKAKREIITAQLEIAKIQRESFAPSSIAMLGGSQFSQVGAWEQGQEARRSAQEEIIAGLEEQLFILDAQEEAQRMLNGGMSAASAIQAKLVSDKQAELLVAKELEAATANAHQVYAQTRMESAQIAEQVALIESGMSQSAVDALRFAGVDLASGVSAAAKEAATLAANMGISLNAALSFINMSSSMSYGQAGARGDPRDFLPGGKKYTTSNFKPFVYTPPKKGKSGGSGGGANIDPMEELRQQIKLQNELLGVSEAQERVLKALGDDRSKYSQKEIDAVTAEIEAYNQKKEAIERTKDIMETVSSSMEDAFMSMVDGTKSAKDAFKSMAAEILKELYRVLVVQRMVSAISGAFSFASGPSTGSFGLPFGGANASGGSMVTGKSYLVGENGPELVIPRHSGTVVNANQTAAMGGGSGATVVNNNITVTGSDAAMVRTEVAKMIPQITNATKSAIIDAKQRGGQMAAAFR